MAQWHFEFGDGFRHLIEGRLVIHWHYGDERQKTNRFWFPHRCKLKCNQFSRHNASPLAALSSRCNENENWLKSGDYQVASRSGCGGSVWRLMSSEAPIYYSRTLFGPRSISNSTPEECVLKFRE